MSLAIDKLYKEKLAEISVQSPDNPPRGIRIPENRHTFYVSHKKKVRSFSWGLVRSKFTKHEAFYKALQLLKRWKKEPRSKRKQNEKIKGHDGSILPRGVTFVPKGMGIYVVEWNDPETRARQKPKHYHVKSSGSLERAKEEALAWRKKNLEECPPKNKQNNPRDQRKGHKGQTLPQGIKYDRVNAGYNVQLAIDGKVFYKRFSQHDNPFNATLDSAWERALECLTIKVQEKEAAYEKKHGRKKRKKIIRIDSLQNVLPTYLRVVPKQKVYIVSQTTTGISKIFSYTNKESQQQAFEQAKRFLEEELLPKVPRTRNRKYLNGTFLQGNGKGISEDTAWNKFYSSAQSRGMLVTMSREQMKNTIWDLPCWYCHAPSTPLNRSSPDRIDSYTKEYSVMNTIPACTWCNQARRNLTIRTFLGHLRRILIHHRDETIEIPEELEEDDKKAILNPDPEELRNYRNHYIAVIDVNDEKLMSCKYREKKNQSKREKIDFELSSDHFCFLKKQNCYGCNRGPTEVSVSADRFDSDAHYTLSNVIPACHPCNIFRGQDSCKDFINQIEKILRNLKFQLLNRKTEDTGFKTLSDLLSK